MRTHAARGVLLLLPALCFAACSNGGFDTVNGTVIPESDWSDAVVEAQCNQQLSCDCYVLAAPEGQDPYAYQLAQCRANRRAELEHHMAQMQALGMHYDGACAAAKLAAAKGWGCADDSHLAAARGSYLDQASVCHVYYGDVGEGEECDTSPYDDCGSGLACVYDYNNVDGGIYSQRCRRMFSAGEGDACDDDRVCAANLFCSNVSCQRYPQVGQACPDGRCAPGAGCDFSNGVGLCGPLLADGEDCSAGVVSCLGVCDLGTCASGSATICRWDARYP